ncbi:hypothetical protein G3I44_04190 [Halogeometricum borinquense]|uniref:Uncharacterized protein n=1 Tax=Halogeometricum borinquense TaxID=60847 RepID=A0A482T5X8_9EURY|nr:hypothetical protein [Halogeometricum borinquense]QIB73553.1 hypothetical protein G3I44_04190 [Halogeometricum borinquense]RYJ08287.1 hypothetical protein ELS19_17175 [Halogeometricum borinquense]
MPLVVPIALVETVLEWAPRIGELALGATIAYIVLTRGWQLSKWLTDTRPIQYVALGFVALFVISALFGTVDSVVTALTGNRLGSMVFDPLARLAEAAGVV